MSEKKQKLNRRQLLGAGATGFVGAQVGMSIMQVGGALLPQIDPMDKIRRILATGDSKAFAQAIQPAANPVIQICIIDKFQQALFLQSTSSKAAIPGIDGIAGNPAAALQYEGAVPGKATDNVTWRNMPLTALFGNRLVSGITNPNYNIAIIPKWTSQQGGHSLMNSDVNVDSGGLNYVIEKNAKSTGVMGAIGYNLRASANNSRDSFVSPGRVPMKTYGGVGEVRNNLKNSVAALAAPGSKAYSLRKRFDQLASKYDTTVDQLQTIKDLVNPVMQPLLDAINAPDIVKRQLQSIVALAKAGLASNFMMAVPWNDTNGGNSISNPGGSQNLSPYLGTCMIADIYAFLSQVLPNAVTVTVSDGGRSANNGDAAGGMCIISGPSNIVNNGVFCSSDATSDVGQIPDIGALGSVNDMSNSGGAYQMSDKSNLRILQHRHVLSLIAKIVHGIDTGEPYPLGISPKAPKAA